MCTQRKCTVKRQDTRSKYASRLRMASGTIVTTDKATRHSCINENRLHLKQLIHLTILFQICILCYAKYWAM